MGVKINTNAIANGDIAVDKINFSEGQLNALNSGINASGVTKLNGVEAGAKDNVAYFTAFFDVEETEEGGVGYLVSGGTVTIDGLETALSNNKIPMLDVYTKTEGDEDYEKIGTAVFSGAPEGEYTFFIEQFDIYNVSIYITQEDNEIQGTIHAGYVYTLLYQKEDKSNKVTSISAQSTDDEYPTAKATYDFVNSNDKVFIGDNNTTYAEFEAAINAGKAVFIRHTRNNVTTVYRYYYTYSDGQMAFTCGELNNACIVLHKRQNESISISENVWQYKNIVQSLSASSTAQQYPSAKCVYDELQSMKSLIYAAL